jgi:hypothetical protein
MKKRILAVLLAVVICLSLPVSVTPASAASSKDAVNKAVKSYFEAAKKCDFKTINSLTYDKDKKIDIKGVKASKNTYNYLKKWNKQIKYSITSTKVSGSKATVKVKVTYVNSEVMSAFLFASMLSSAFTSAADDSSENLSDDVSDQLIGKAVKRAAKYTRLKTETVTISLVKSGSKWKINDDDAANIVMGDIEYSLVSLFE